MTPENLLAEWARLLFESLADAGVREVVVSPGSRSTPLSWAALACSRLHATRIVDERDAAFFAVGHARVTGVPAVVVCTSGSAAANYFPAIVEAKRARVPLIVVTADRPFELMDAGASQTLDQTKLYGDYVRRFVDVGMPDASDGALAALRRVAAQAVAEATHPDAPGVVHLNVRARKPLEPVSASTEDGRALERRVSALLSAPIVAVPHSPRIASDATVAALASAVARAKRGLVVCGPAGIDDGRTLPALAAFSRVTGFPVYAETTSQLRVAEDDGPGADGLDLLLRSTTFRDAFRPDVVLQIGDSPTSGAWERFVLARPELERHVLTSSGYPDPSSRARSMIVADVPDVLARLAESAKGRSESVPQRRFAAALARLNDAAFGVADGLLRDQAALSEGAATRVVATAVPDGGVFAVGNSLPVRHVDAFVRARRGGPVRVWSQRGVSGIDGVVAGAAGAAMAAAAPTVLLLGDVSAFHDVGGFAVAAASTVPVVVVVLNNDGGRIFEQLPFSDSGVPEAEFAFWTTPHGRTFEGLRSLFGVDHAFCRTRAELEAGLAHALERRGCSVLEVPLPPHGARAEYAELARRLESTLAPLVSTLRG